MLTCPLPPCCAGRKPSSSFLAAAASRFLEQPGSYKPKELSSLVFALAKLAVASGTALPQAPALADAVAQQLQQRAAQYDVESLCSSVWAVVKLGQYVPGPVLEVVSAQLLHKVSAAAATCTVLGWDRASKQAWARGRPLMQQYQCTCQALATPLLVCSTALMYAMDIVALGKWQQDANTILDGLQAADKILSVCHAASRGR
jgi:hypothetical protein